MRNWIFSVLFIVIFSLSAFAQDSRTAVSDAPLSKQGTGSTDDHNKKTVVFAEPIAPETETGGTTRGEEKIVFIGDSITEGWNLGEAFPNKPYLNRGISGETTPYTLFRFPSDVIALQPKVVVILIGTNDIAGNTGPITLEQTESNLAAMAEMARVNGVNVILASILPVNDYSTDKYGNPIIRTIQRPPAQIIALNTWIRAYAAEYRFIYLDYFTAMIDANGFLREDLSNDGLHPNAAGYNVMQPLAVNAIRGALKKKQRR